MPRKAVHTRFNRANLKLYSLAERRNRVHIQPGELTEATQPRELAESQKTLIAEAASRIRAARNQGKPRILACGAHAVKNKLGPAIARLAAEGWITHVAMNGAGIIHDWELAFQGATSEDVRENVASGTFGLWEETGFYINLALVVGAFQGLGYGESVGALIASDGLQIPSEDGLRETVAECLETTPDKAAAAADLLLKVREFTLKTGELEVEHPHKGWSVAAALRDLNIPMTGHPMVGHDIIYCHPMNSVAAIGRTAERDFLLFAEQVRNLSEGVYLSVGSAVMSPMIFEKSMSMAQNVALQRGQRIAGHYVLVVDMQQSTWDWDQGEPPEDHPDYYLRYYKTFSRMGGTTRYLCADNRDFFPALLAALESGR